MTTTPKFQLQLDEKITALMLQHHLASEAFEEEQLAEAIREALLAGDFVKQVVVGGLEHRQRIIYLPGERAHQLAMRVHDLEMENEALRARVQAATAALAEQGD